MDRQVSLWERWTETAGWLGVRVRHSGPQEGELASSGAGLLLVPGGSCTSWGTVVAFNDEGHRVCTHCSLISFLLSLSQSISHTPCSGLPQSLFRNLDKQGLKSLWNSSRHEYASHLHPI